MLTREQILKKIQDKPWISPFEKIIAIYSAKENLVQVYEYHARATCYGAAAWAVYHYKRTSDLVMEARRDGIRDIFTLKPGESKLDLKPSVSSAGIEAVKVVEDKIQITYSGLAGGGVGSTLCRAAAAGVDGAEIHAEGGGDRLGNATIIIPKMVKLQVGVDDTDKPGAGATWSLANEIAYTLSKQEGVEYLNHTLVQLFPGTPEKTTNCVSSVLTFAVKPDKFDYLKNELMNQFSTHTLSKHTGLAFWSGINIPKKLTQFSDLARQQIVTNEHTKYLASALDISMIPVTGERGCIGAVAGLGYAENQEKAIKLE